MIFFFVVLRSTLTLTLSMTISSSDSSPVLSLFGFLLAMSFYDQQFQQDLFSFLVAVWYLLFFKMFSPSHVTSSFVPRESWSVSLTSKDIVPKSVELFALQRLCKKISNHVVCSTVLNLHVSLLNLIGYKEAYMFSARVCFPELFIPFVSNKIALLLS
jgi:hypothetical protein